MSLVSRKALAASLGVDIRTVSKWQDDGMPVAERGRGSRASKFDLAQCQAWREQRVGSADGHSTGFIDVARERARKERAQAQLAEQAYQIKAGELLPRETVERRWTAELAAIRAKLLSWKRSTVAEQLFRAAIADGQAVFDDVFAASIDELLTDLSQPDSLKKKKRGRAA